MINISNWSNIQLSHRKICVHFYGTLLLSVLSPIVSLCVFANSLSTINPLIQQLSADTWTQIQCLKQTCRYIYITHQTTFNTNAKSITDCLTRCIQFYLLQYLIMRLKYIKIFQISIQILALLRNIKKRHNHRTIHFQNIDPHCYLILVRRTNHSVLGLTPMVSVVVVMVLVVNHGQAVCLINCLYLINTQTLSSSSLPTQLDLAY